MGCQACYVRHAGVHRSLRDGPSRPTRRKAYVLAHAAGLGNCSVTRRREAASGVYSWRRVPGDALRLAAKAWRHLSTSNSRSGARDEGQQRHG